MDGGDRAESTLTASERPDTVERCAACGVECAALERDAALVQDLEAIAREIATVRSTIPEPEQGGTVDLRALAAWLHDLNGRLAAIHARLGGHAGADG